MTPPHRCVSGTVSPTPADGRFSDESDNVSQGRGRNELQQRHRLLLCELG